MAESGVAAPRKELTREQKAYQFRRIVTHLSEAAAWPQLFALLEEKSFLADQADYFGGFEATAEDIEGHALAAAIRAGDWDRFLRYASMALNLRGLAEGLAEPEILRALVQGDRVLLARDVADRLAEPLRRAEARAILAAAVGSAHRSFPELLRGIEEDLEAGALTSTVLSTIARFLGPELSSRWRGWIVRVPSGAGAVWAAIAESWLDRGETRLAAVWEALGEIGDHRLLLGLVARIGEIDRGEIAEMFERITQLFAEAPFRLQALASFLGRQARSRPELAVAAWERWRASGPIPWTEELIEACRELIQHLQPGRVESLCSSLETPEAVAAVRVADLEAHPDDSRTAAALQAVGSIPDGPVKLHWSLRYLTVRPCEPVQEVRGQVGAVAAYLHELRYDANDRDLCRFLDLADRFFPGDLERLVEDVAWSPSSRPETLLTLATETIRERVAERLLEAAERFAATVSLNEADGFRLRGELIRRAAIRVCLLRMDLNGFVTAAGHLLPEEEDALREALAPALATAGRRAQASEIAEGIGNPRTRFLTHLRILPTGEIPASFLAPRSLYAAMASAQSLEEESLALSALLSNPIDPKDVARRWISPIRSGELQTQAMLRLSRHALVFQRSVYGRRQDLAAALEVARGSIAVETDERLVALTPEIAALGAEAGPGKAVAEFQEAARRIAETDTVPWELRAHALEHLLFQIGPCLLPQPMQTRRAVRKACAVLESIARLPLGPRSGSSLDELRSRWHEILPILVAVTDQIPNLAGKSLDLALREGISACGAAGGETAKRIFFLCRTPGPERLKLAGRFLTGRTDSGFRQGLAYLLGRHDPDQIPETLKPLDQEMRDSLLLRLLIFRWVAPERAGLLLSSIKDSVSRREADLWLRLDGPEWLGDLAMFVSLRTVDPSQPGFREILDRVWRCDTGQSCPAFAEAFIGALRRGGRERGDAVLRLWLHAHLGPVLGTGQPEALERSEDVRSALKRSLLLSP